MVTSQIVLMFYSCIGLQKLSVDCVSVLNHLVWCVIVFVHVVLNCIEGERDTIAVDSNPALEWELCLCEELWQPQPCKETLTQQDLWSCQNSIHINYSFDAHSNPTE